MPEITMTEQELDYAADLWECGMEQAEQLRSELNHTYWTLDGKWGTANQLRMLNQTSIELATIHGEFN